MAIWSRLKSWFLHQWSWKVSRPVMKRKRDMDPDLKEKVQLLHEIRQAEKDWHIALKRIDWMVDFEQIDYAIFLLEAAEKRYAMLLKQAKSLRMDALDLYRKTGVI